MIWDFSTSDNKTKEWDSLFKVSPVATWFQTKAAFDFFNGLNFAESFAVGVERSGELKGVIVGFILKDGGKIKQFLSRRAVINGGPLLADDITEEELSALLFAVIAKLRGKAIYIETRNYFDYTKWKDVFEKNGFVLEPHYDIVINTETVDVVNSRMGKSRKRDLNLSLKNGVSIIENPTQKDVTDYYTILDELYRTKVKTSLYPLSFFIQLWQSPFSKFILARYNDEIVGGTVLVFDDNNVFEWFACGRDGIYKNVYPSTVVTYQGIMFAAENGYKRFDMMGAGAPGDGGYGVRDFKTKFGGEMVEYGRFKHINSRLLYKIGEIGVKIIKSLK